MEIQHARRISGNSRLAHSSVPALKHNRATTASLNGKITGELVVGSSEHGLCNYPESVERGQCVPGAKSKDATIANLTGESGGHAAAPHACARPQSFLARQKGEISARPPSHSLVITALSSGQNGERVTVLLEAAPR